MSRLASKANVWYNKLIKLFAQAMGATIPERDDRKVRFYRMRSISHHAHEGRPDTKNCTHCLRDLPATPEYFRRDRYYKDGLTSKCKQCLNPSKKVIPEGQKQCTICLNYYPATADHFFVDKRNTSGFRSWCKICHAQKSKAYYDAHDLEQRHYRARRREQYKLRNRRYYQANREKLIAQTKHYRQTHRDRILEMFHRYRHTERGRIAMRINSHKRQARKHKAPGRHSAQELYQQYTNQRGRCYYCRKKVAWGQHHIDHVVPLSRGGSNDISNLVVACPHCNLSKNNKLPHEFFEGGRLL